MGLVLAALVGLVCGVSLLIVRVVDGAEVSVGGSVAVASAWIAWLGAGPVALAAADRQDARSREEGLDELGGMRGVPAAWLDASRTLAAMTQVALVIAAPLTVLALVAAAIAPSAAAAGRALAHGVGALAFAVATGIAVGGLAALFGRARRGGPLLLIAIVVGPWLIASAFGRAAWSIPGALSATLSLLLTLGQGGS
jgi:hypothetical protein